MQRKNRCPLGVNFLIGLTLFQGLSGILGGIGLIIDPSGESLQIPIQWLEGSIFNNYLIPGIILFLVLGCCPLIVFGGLLKQRKWSWYGALILAISLIIWIIVEIIVIGYQPDPPLQLIYGLIGIIMLAIVFLPAVLSHYKISKNHLRGI